MDLAGEDRLIRRLRRRLEIRGNRFLGDDAALLPASGDLAVSVDQQIAGVHFPEGLDTALLARRALAVALSDLAAMGAEPLYVFLALAFPAASDAPRLLDALLPACRRYGVELAGGDLARSPRLAATLTVVGRRYPRGRWLRRHLARPGDLLWSGGPLGLSALGRLLIDQGASIAGRRVELPARLALPRSLAAAASRAVRRHLQPTPQLELGLWLALRRRAAAIDVSDGLALDLHRLCHESDVGARLDARSLTASRHERQLAGLLNVEFEELALSGGEDYVLLFALPPSVRPPRPLACRSIGRITDEKEIRLADSRCERPLPPAGWDHLR
jgi:thiamine-monophosphate kinase